MESSYSIEVYDDFVDESLVNEIVNITRRAGFRYGWKSNNQVSFSHWNLPLSRTGAGSGNRKDIRRELPAPVMKIWETFQPTLIPSVPVLVRTYINGYAYGNDGYIHQDSQAPEDMTAILYLNKEWNANWAGETAIFDSNTGEIIKSVLPKWRRLLIFPANMYHVGRGVSRICPHLRTVLVFKARPEEPMQQDNSRLQLEKVLLEAGIENTVQLLKTYDNLKNWNCGFPLCFAGALYPIYVPNAPLKMSFEELRPRILELFGTEADRLAQLFATADLPKLLADGVGTNKFDGSEIPLQENDRQFAKLFHSALQLAQVPTAPKPDEKKSE